MRTLSWANFEFLDLHDATKIKEKEEYTRELRVFLRDRPCRVEANRKYMAGGGCGRDEFGGRIASASGGDEIRGTDL